MNRISIALFGTLLFSSCAGDPQRPQSPVAHTDTMAAAGTTAAHMEHQSIWEPPASVPEGIRALVPAGYTVIDMSSGDANLDGRTDYLVTLRSILRDTLSAYPERPEPRPLLLVLTGADGRTELRARNDHAVLCYDCGGVFDDPFIRTVIKNGYFTIEHGVSGGAHWESFTTFRYDKARDDWFLHKEHYTNYRLNDSQDPDAEALVVDADKLRTVKDFGERRFENYDTYKDDK